MVVSNIKVLRLIKVSRGETKSDMRAYEEFRILDGIREGKFKWLGHVMRREPPPMLHGVVNYNVKGTTPRGRPRT